MTDTKKKAEPEKKKVLPKKLQVEMLEFFMKTSIPRKKKLANPLSDEYR